MADEPSASPQIFTYLDGRIPIRCHEHVAVVHRGDAPAAWGAEFLGEGLSRGDRCCCVIPPARRDGMLTRLRDLGPDPQRHQAHHALEFPPEAQVPADLLEWGKRFFDEAEAVRAPAVRWLEDGVWMNPAELSVVQFFELHSRLNYLVKQYPSVILCSYATNHLEIPHLFSAIAVHRHLLVEDTLVRDNPFYIPAEKFLAMNREDREGDLRDIYREVGFDLGRLLSTLAGYGQLQNPGS